MENATTLLKLAASGDEQAEAKLFSLIGPEIVEIVRERIERGNDGELANSYTLARSMFQQVMKHRNFPRESMRGFLNYLRWKSRMLLIDRARRSQRHRDFQASAGQQKVEKLATKENTDHATRLTVHEALNKLADDVQEIVWNKEVAGCTLQEIADLTGYSVAKVFRLHKQGVGQLRCYLGDDWYE